MEKLELSPKNHFQIAAATSLPQGLIILCAVTGGGKTTTWQEILSGVVERSTLEDAQIKYPNLESLPEKLPFVIVADDVSEFDKAVPIVRYAAKTLVIAVLRSGRAGGALVRFVDMGVSEVDLLAVSPLVITQQLCRRLCAQCRQPVQVNDNDLASLGFHASDFALTDGWVYEPKGCTACKSGYRGRVPLIAVQSFSELADVRGEAFQVRNPRQFTPNELRQDALLKLVTGSTSISEVKLVL